jgi:hypothetical protein
MQQPVLADRRVERLVRIPRKIGLVAVGSGSLAGWGEGRTACFGLSRVYNHLSFLVGLRDKRGGGVLLAARIGWETISSAIISFRFDYRLEIGTIRQAEVQWRDAHHHSPCPRRYLRHWIGMSIV